MHSCLCIIIIATTNLSSEVSSASTCPSAARSDCPSSISFRRRSSRSNRCGTDSVGVNEVRATSRARRTQTDTLSASKLTPECEIYTTLDALYTLYMHTLT